MRFILLGFLLLGLSFAVTEKEFKEDRAYLSRVEKRLEELDRRAQKEGPKTEIIDELNSYGYPLYSMKDKYMLEEGSRFQRFYRRVSAVYEKLLYVKRGLFPKILFEEAKELKIPVCRVKAEGEGRKRLTIGIKDPKSEKDVLKLMTQTQLRYAQLLGIEEINFKKCR